MLSFRDIDDFEDAVFSQMFLSVCFLFRILF